MGKDRLEEYIKDQIHDHRSEVNPDAIWAAIKQPEQKKRKPFWLFGLFGVLLVTALIGYQFLGNHSTETLEKQITQTQKSTSDSKLDNINSSNDKQNEILQETIPVTTDEELKSTASSNIIPQTNTITKENTSTSNLEHNDESPSLKPIQKIVSSASLSNSAKEVSSSANTNFHSAKANPVSQTIENINKENADISGPISELQGTINKGQRQVKAQSKVQTPLTPFFLNLLDSRTYQIDFERSITPEFLALPKNAAPIDPLKEVKTSAWNLSVYYGYLKGSRTLSADTLDMEELQVRNNHEEFMEAWELGALIGYTHRSGLRLETGLNYTQINDRSIVPLVHEKFLYPVPQSFERSVWKEITLINQHRFHKLRMIDVPLHLSYGVSWGKWSLRPGAGINLNLTTASNGNISGLNNGNVDLVDVSTTQYFKSNIGYNLEAKLQVNYFISDNLSLNLSSNYKHYPSSFTLGSLQQRYKLWGLKIGLSKNF